MKNKMVINNEIIKNVVCDSFGLKESEITIDSRKTKYSFPRFAYFTLCRFNTTMTLEEIGATMGKDHSTVSMAIRRNEDLVAIKKNYSNNFKKAESIIKSQTSK